MKNFLIRSAVLYEFSSFMADKAVHGMKAFAKWGYEEPYADVPLPDIFTPEPGGGHNS